MNLVAMPLVHFFYPETAGRSLEEVDLLFTSDSPFVSQNMAEYDRRVAEAGGNIAVATRRLLDEVNGESHLDATRVAMGESNRDELKLQSDVKVESDHGSNV